MITIQSDDFRVIRSKYERLPKKVEDGLVEVLESVFSKAERNTKRRAPRRTGALRKAIKHKVHRNYWNVRGALYIDVDQLYDGKERGTISSGKPDYYPAYVEYGTKSAGRRKRKGEEKGIRTPGNKAKPFMRQGARYLKTKARSQITAMLKALEEGGG